MNKRDSAYVAKLVAAHRSGVADSATVARALAAMHRAASSKVQREICGVIAGTGDVAEYIDFRPAAIGAGCVMVAIDN